MRTLKRMVVIGAIAVGSIFAAAMPASASSFDTVNTPLGDCNGAVDTLCTYCGHWSGNGNPYPYSNCYNNPGNYSFHTCWAWLLGHCYIG